MKRARPLRIGLVLALGLLVVVASVLLSCALGPQPISIRAALAGVDPDRAILLHLRLPRAILAALVGASLATAGAALQAMLRNPLADPFVLGVSGGAALGGSLVLLAAEAASQLFHAGGFLGGAPPVALGAVLGAVGATALVFALGRVGGRLVPQSALLVGVIFNAFVIGVIGVLKILVRPEQSARLLYWLEGTIGYETSTTITVGGCFIGASVLALVALSARLNLLALGDEEAASLGVEVTRSRAAVFFAASAATGAAVSLAGMVGFVGLIVPHLVRAVTGPDHRLLVPASALFGAAFLVLADTGARMAFLWIGTEPPVGALTALIGGPVFLWMLRRSTRRA